MGTCCDAHLPAMVKEYLPNAKNGSVTVQPVENPPKYTTVGTKHECKYCSANAEYSVSYYPKAD